MFSAKSAPPLDNIGLYPYPVFDAAAERRLTLITAPPGFLLADTLAGRITCQDRPLIWLRLDLDDSDPATLLLSVISAVQRLLPDFGLDIKVLMCAKPGPIFGWLPLFTSLGHEIHETLDPSTVLVLENLEYLATSHETLHLLVSYLLPSFPNQSSCILISSRELPAGAIPGQAQHCNAQDLRLDFQASTSLVGRIGTSLPMKQIYRMEMLCDGRPELLAGICMTCKMFGKEFMGKELERARNAEELMENTACALIAQTDPGTQLELRLLVQLGYSHPSLIGNTLRVKLSADEPWLQQLVGDWERIRRIWRPYLQHNLNTPFTQNAELVKHLGKTLIAQGALSQALRLYRWAGDTGSIAQEVCRHATDLLDLGQWGTLRGWIDQLPAASLESYPALLLYRGQISAAQGDFAGSSKTFSKAATLSSAKGEFTTACQSMLADTVVASRLGRYDRALVTAINLLSTATKHGLDSYRGWALWQIGTLWTILGKLEQAATYFEQAKHWIGDASLNDLLEEVRKIVVAQREAQHLLAFHTQAIQEAQAKEEENASRLTAMLISPAPSLTELLEKYGWSGVPSPMSFPPNLSKTTGGELEQSKLWQKLLNRYRSLRKTSDPDMRSTEVGHKLTTSSLDAETEEHLLMLMTAMDELLSIDTGSAGDKVSPDPQAGDFRSSGLLTPIPTSDHTTPGQQSRELTDVAKPTSKPMLTAYFFGSFRVFVNDSPVDIWPSMRARSLCKYLLIHRQRPVHREKLMDVFWPSASPESARNSLNVALHDLRQAYRAITDTAIVEFVDGAYLLNPLLDVWIDIEAFENHLQASQQFEITQQREMLIKELESAASLYQGDFLADDLYEDWTVLIRERLRLAYLDVLYLLSRYYFESGQYAVCTAVCQNILARDNCREDVHCLLMRCYAHQSQVPLALRQFQVCVQALRQELDVDPAASTVALYEKLRHREITQHRQAT